MKKTNNFSKEENKAFTKVRQQIAKANHRKMSEIKFYDYEIAAYENIWYVVTYEKIFCGEIMKDRIAARFENGEIVEMVNGFDC